MSPASSLSQTTLNIHPQCRGLDFHPHNFQHHLTHQFLTQQFLTLQFSAKSPAIRASSCPPDQLPEYDDELASILSDSSSVMAPQETLRQSLLPSASQSYASDTQLSVCCLMSFCIQRTHLRVFSCNYACYYIIAEIQPIPPKRKRKTLPEEGQCRQKATAVDFTAQPRASFRGGGDTCPPLPESRPHLSIFLNEALPTPFLLLMRQVFTTLHKTALY